MKHVHAAAHAITLEDTKMDQHGVSDAITESQLLVPQVDIWGVRSTKMIEDTRRYLTMPDVITEEHALNGWLPITRRSQPLSDEDCSGAHHESN